MKVVGTRLLVEFASLHADARIPLETWLAEVREATWENPSNVKARFVSAGFLSDNRIVFNIKGNSYRLLVRISYKVGVVAVLRIGTHAEYDRWRL